MTSARPIQYPDRIHRSLVPLTVDKKGTVLYTNHTHNKVNCSFRPNILAGEYVQFLVNVIDRSFFMREGGWWDLGSTIQKSHDPPSAYQLFHMPPPPYGGHVLE